MHRQGLLTLWHRGHIPPGTDQASAVAAALKRAALILLLISPDYLSCDDCYEVELVHAMQRHQADTARVIPILLRPIEDREANPFGRLAVLPTNEQPITRWPDRDEAFADVVAGIRRAISDLPASSLGPSPVPASQVWTIPYPHNPVFTGRKELLEQLTSQLQAGQTMALTQPPQAISGLGGVGKTHLAVEYAYQHRADYQAVLWMRAESTEALTSSCVTLAKELNLSQKDERETALIVAAVQRWLRTNTGWLLILDNGDDLTVVRAFLPPDYKGHVLLTTRAQAMGRLAHRLDVDTLPPELGALFLLRRAGHLAPTASLEQASPADREAALAITDQLGGLPLALDQAGAYIEETGCRLADYQQHRADLLKERGGQMSDHPEAVADLLRLCAFLAPDAIPEELFTQGAAYLGPRLAPVAADPFRLNQALEALRAYSLVQRDATNKTLSVHRLVQAVLQDAMMPEERKQWIECTVRVVDATFPKVKFPLWSACERCLRCLPHAQACLSLIEQETITIPETTRLMTRTGWYLTERGQYEKAEDALQQAPSLWEQHLGPEYLSTAQILSVLAKLYMLQGRYTEAEPLFLRALSIREERLGPRHPNTATSLNNVALLYIRQGKYTEAQLLFQQSLAIYEEYLGFHYPSTATSLSNLASLYIRQRKYLEAEPLFRRAIAITEESLGFQHPDTLKVRRNYALCLRALGRHVEADQVEARDGRRDDPQWTR